MVTQNKDLAQQRQWASRRRRIGKIITKLLKRIIPRLAFSVPILIWYLAPLQLQAPFDSIAYFVVVTFALTQLLPLLEDLFVLMAMVIQLNVKPSRK